MDEQHKLVIELHAKLAELDLKVGDYRRNMVAEFEKYSEDLLRNTPKDICAGVSETIATAKNNYQALYPPPILAACESGSAAAPPPPPPPSINQEPPSSSSPAHDDEPSTHPQYSFPTPKSHFRALTQWKDDTELARSPHEREREFQGVFTPVYLPLLGDNRHERRTSHEAITPPSPRSIPEALQAESSPEISRSLPETPDLPKPPPPKRRDTEDSTVSDASEGTVRRSALRRSSNSSMKPSPRRVRFEFEGVEVLPTSSPLPPPTLLSEGTLLSQPSEEDEPRSEQVEDVSSFPEEESPPRPKRITSSQRLLALSRSSKEEDGTTWMTVSAPPDGSPSVEKTSGSSDSLMDLPKASPEISAPVESQESLLEQPTLSKEAVARANAAQPDEDTDSDDDDALNMPSLSSMKGRKSLPEATIMSPASPRPYEPQKPSPASAHVPDRSWKDFNSLGVEGKSNVDQDLTLDDLDDEVFNFEERDYHASALEAPEDEEDDEDDSPSTKSPASPGGVPVLSQYSQSLGRPILRQMSQPQQSQPAGSLGAMGSYRGHPFSMPIVNEDVHAKIAAMEDVKSFVGSVDGRSGYDYGDMASYRASYNGNSFNGAPRSLKERMMMEELGQGGGPGRRNN